MKLSLSTFRQKSQPSAEICSSVQPITWPYFVTFELNQSYSCFTMPGCVFSSEIIQVKRPIFNELNYQVIQRRVRILCKKTISDIRLYLWRFIGNFDQKGMGRHRSVPVSLEVKKDFLQSRLQLKGKTRKMEKPKKLFQIGNSVFEAIKGGRIK